MKRINLILVSALAVVCASPALPATRAQSVRPNDENAPAISDELEAAHDFRRTRVIGYSQVGNPRGGWFVAGGVFESTVGDDHWELLWAGGAGVDRWRNADYLGWKRPLVSPCPGDDPPDRVLLSVSGPYGDDEKAWAEAIAETVKRIREKIPSARQIILQPVVGGPEGKTCVPPGRDGGRVRASWQHNHVANAIRAVVKQHEAKGDDAGKVEVVAGHLPQVRTCADYSDALGHLTPEAAESVARRIGEYYAQLDGQKVGQERRQE
jgi:hypothetical protein